MIFVERGWGAFGWYDVFFPYWVYLVILAAMLRRAPAGLLAALARVALAAGALAEGWP